MHSVLRKLKGESPMQVCKRALSSISKNSFSYLSVALVAVFVFFAFNVRSQERDIPNHVLYVETNDPAPGKNAILAYRINPNDGSLSLLGIFPTRGAGGDDFDNRLGPFDHDQEVILSKDKKLLFAINGGSNTIAVFRVHGNGSLTHVEGSPFSSGGLTPVSVGFAGDKLYVVNANNNVFPGFVPNNTPANYTGFRVEENGRLVPIPGSTVEIASDSNPTQANISSVGEFLFGVDLFGVPYQPQIVPFLPARGSLLHSFQIHSDGTLQEAPGSPYLPPANSRLAPTIVGSGYLLGLKAHPTERILYAGEVITNQVATYTYDNNGSLTLVHETPLNGTAICWFEFDKEHRHLFSADSGTNSIGVFDISDPRVPVYIQELQLTLPGSNPPPGIVPSEFPSLPFQLALHPSGKFLYVVNRAVADSDYPEGNAIHIMQVQSDGTLVEPAFSPVFLPVPPNVRPTGNAIR
jgi:6-phosphogluconolactonase (cycloisomerase 2 family)